MVFVYQSPVFYTKISYLNTLIFDISPWFVYNDNKKQERGDFYGKNDLCSGFED